MRTTRHLTTALMVLATLVFSAAAYAESTGFLHSWKPYQATLEDQLRRAAGAGDLSEIKRLIAKGASVNSRDAEGWTALMWAQVGDQPEAAALLLDRGAEVDMRDRTGNTVLFHAAMAGRSEVMDVLVTKGADVDARNRRGWTPLMEASVYGRSEAIEILLARGANPNAASRDGYTPLGLAEANGKSHAAMLLLANGADPNLNTKKLLAASGLAAARSRGPVRVRLAGLLRNPSAADEVCRDCGSPEAAVIQKQIFGTEAAGSGSVNKLCRQEDSRDRRDSVILGPVSAPGKGPRSATPLVTDERGSKAAERMLADALQNWEQLRRKYPDAAKRLQETIRNGGSVSTNPTADRYLSQALTMWNSFHRENPELATQLLNLVGSAR